MPKSLLNGVQFFQFVGVPLANSLPLPPAPSGIVSVVARSCPHPVTDEEQVQLHVHATCAVSQCPMTEGA